MIAAYRQQRIAEERQAERKGRFGRVYPIGREDYTREVTEASNVSEEDDKEEMGTGVVCLLYKDGIPRSNRACEHVRILAARYPRTKFVSIVGDKCIPNLPDSRVPMFIVYKKGDIRHQIVAWGADQERRLDELETILMAMGVIHSPERPPPQNHDEDDNHSSDSDDDRPFLGTRSATTSTNGRSKKNIRDGRKVNDSDEEFDFDL